MFRFLAQQAGASRSDRVVRGPASLNQARTSPGRALEPPLRQEAEQRFGHDFSRVRVHSDAAATESALAMDALAYTVGHDIVFQEGRFPPRSRDGFKLMAHELAHVVQQERGGSAVTPQIDGGLNEAAEAAAAAYVGRPGLVHVSGASAPGLARQPAAARPQETAGTPRTASPADPAETLKRVITTPNYFENNITKISFFSAELAIIYYKDGSTLELGLVPKFMTPPFVEVDYHTPSEGYQLLAGRDKGISVFRVTELQTVPPGMSWGDVQKRYAHHIDFVIEPKSKRLAPSRVNTRTAPTICKILLESEQKFVERSNEITTMALGVLKVLQVQTMNPLMGGGMAPPGGGAVARVGTGAVAKGMTGATEEGLTFVEIGAGDLKAAIELAKKGGVKVVAVDPVVPAAAAVQELQGLGGQFVKGVAADLARGTADHVFQYFPWRITGTGKWVGGGTFRLVEDTVRLLKPNGAAHFVTEELQTAKFLAEEASQRGLRAVITKTTAGAAAPGATGVGVPGFGKALEVWMVNIYK
jgi:hypothetical protein